MTRFDHRICTDIGWITPACHTARCCDEDIRRAEFAPLPLVEPVVAPEPVAVDPQPYRHPHKWVSYYGLGEYDRAEETLEREGCIYPLNPRKLWKNEA